MNINPSWKYIDVMCRIWTLRSEYQKILASFYYTKDRNEFIRKVKNQIYCLKFNENRKDEIWNLMNYVKEYKGENEYEKNIEFDD